MRGFLTALLQCSVSMSLVTLAYAAILPLLSKRYAAKWRYIVWLVIAAGWIFPFRPRITLSFLTAQMTDIPIQPIINAIPSIADAGDIVNAPVTIPLWWVLAAIWILGVVSVILYHALRHGRFMKMVRRWGEPVTDSESLGTLDSLKSELEIKAQVKLSVCQSITSPMLIGFFHPVVLLPPIKIAADELSLILKHELIHFKRRDLWYKALILTATVLHWFNPVVYLMAKAAAVQCEISCDALALQGTDFLTRKQYGETIIGVVRNGSKLQTALSTNFYGGKRGMKNRISSIIDTKRKKAGVAILCLALVGIIMTGATLTATAKAKEADTRLSSGMSMAGTLDGKNYIYTDDGGNTWMSEAEYKEKNPDVMDELEFWEIDEFEKWMEQERIVYQELADNGQRFYDNETEQWRTWTQQDVNELYKIWQEQLESMKRGYRYTKDIELPNGALLAGAFEPDTGTASSASSTVITRGDGTIVSLGDFDTAEEAEAAVKKYLDEQVRAGTMTQQEANEILKSKAIE